MSKFVAEYWVLFATGIVIVWFVFVHLLDGLPDDLLSVLYKRIREARKDK